MFKTNILLFIYNRSIDTTLFRGIADNELIDWTVLSTIQLSIPCLLVFNLIMSLRATLDLSADISLQNILCTISSTVVGF